MGARARSSLVDEGQKVIDTLDALPGLSRSWLGDLDREDPGLFDELAPDIVIEAGGHDVGDVFPAGLGEVLRTVKLCGKTIGAFRFAPCGDGPPTVEVDHYDRQVRGLFDAPADLLFVGEYGSGVVFVSPQGVGIYDPDRMPDGPRIVASDFAGFLLAQANAYDAYKAHIVQQADGEAYRRRQSDTARAPRFATVDVAAIFEAQIKS